MDRYLWLSICAGVVCTVLCNGAVWGVCGKSGCKFLWGCQGEWRGKMCFFDNMNHPQWHSGQMEGMDRYAWFFICAGVVYKFLCNGAVLGVCGTNSGCKFLWGCQAEWRCKVRNLVVTHGPQCCSAQAQRLEGGNGQVCLPPSECDSCSGSI
jgi:hypothetical protein